MTPYYKADIQPKECAKCRAEHGKLWQFYSGRIKSFTPSFSKIKDIDSRWRLYQCPACSNLFAWDSLSTHQPSGISTPRYKFLPAEDLTLINHWLNKKWTLTNEQKDFLRSEPPSFYASNPPGENAIPCQITTQDNKIFPAALAYTSTFIPLNNKWQTNSESEVFNFQWVVFIDEVKKIERSPYAFPIEARKNIDKYLVPGEERLRADAIYFYSQRLDKTIQFMHLPGLFEGNGTKASELIPIVENDKRRKNTEIASPQIISDIVLVVCPR